MNVSVQVGAEFLAKLFKESTIGYSAVNTARSALSAIITPINGIPFGKQPLIQRLMRGVFKQRPSLPKYTVTFDVKKVFDFIESLDFDHLDLEMLTKCLAVMLCLLSGQRSQTLTKLSIDFMHLEESKVVFYIPSLLKTSRPNFHQAPLEFVAYPQNESICPIRMLRLYLKATEGVRIDKTLLMSYVKPFRAVGTKTIARWVTDILNRAGISTKTFTAHSTRSASTSKASKHLSLADVNKAAGWTNVKTFAKYYNKTITNNFCESLLNNL